MSESVSSRSVELGEGVKRDSWRWAWYLAGLRGGV
jgi:hypothetical protein